MHYAVNFQQNDAHVPLDAHHSPKTFVFHFDGIQGKSVVVSIAAAGADVRCVEVESLLWVIV
jgi:hypothetical protein